MWDIWPRGAAATLRAYLAEHCAEFVHNGKRLEPADVQDWIVSQACSWRRPCNDRSMRTLCAVVQMCPETPLFSAF